MKNLLILFMLSLGFLTARSQEFNVTVSVTSPMVEGTEKKIFETLQQDLFDFVNNRQWTNYAYKPEERIESRENESCSAPAGVQSLIQHPLV